MNSMFKIATAVFVMGLVACNGDATQETPVPTTVETVPVQEASDEQLEGGTSWDASDLPSIPETTEDDADAVVDATVSV